MAHDTLSHLHTRTVDAHAGFVKMVEMAEPEFRPIAQRFHDLHHVHADRLATMLRGLGETPDHDGSFMATVNTAVVTLRGWLDEIDDDVMDQVRSGERHVLSAFDDAVADGANGDYEPDLVEMKGELTRLLDETAHLD